MPVSKKPAPKVKGSGEVSRYKLLVGVHQDRSGDPDPNATGPDEGKPTLVTYHKGDVVESETDLEEKFGSEKFKRVGSERPFKQGGPLKAGTKPGRVPKSGQPDHPDAGQFETEEEADEPYVRSRSKSGGDEEEADDDELESMSRDELVKVAEKEGVDLPRVRSKPNVLNAIRDYRSKRQADEEEDEEEDEEVEE